VPALCFDIALRDPALESDMGVSVPLSELKAAMSELLTHGILNAKIFLLIDGLDEYRGAKHEAADLELSQMLMKGAQADHVKILVCSRPVPACYEVFRRCPQLRLQDLTATDIARVVRADLSSSVGLQDLEDLKPGLRDELIHLLPNERKASFFGSDWSLRSC
jgi:hypothetical protein